MNVENPYQSPQDYAEQTPAGRPDLTKRSLRWLLFSFRGRIPRRTYWGVTIVATVAFYAIILVLAPAHGNQPDADFAWVVFISLYSFFMWISLATQVKRWHDRDKSGWWVLISLIPLIGPIFAFVETGCLRGTIGPNQFGDDPTGDAPSGKAISDLQDGQMIDVSVVELDGTSATDDDLAALAGNSQIEELRLGGTAITDGGLCHLRDLTDLRLLDLSLTDVTDEGLESLLGLQKLTSLWLGGTTVSDSGLNRLAKLKELKEIHMVHSQVTEEGVRRFSMLRPDCVVHI